MKTKTAIADVKTAGVSAATLRSLYRMMVKIRRAEDRIAELITAEPNIVCPCHLYTGQEAVAVGVCANLRRDDYVFSTHRSHGHYLAKGGDMKGLMAELYGKAAGCSRGRGGSMHLAAPDIGLPGSCAIVAGSIPLAVGAALAFSLRGQDAVAVAFFGDGATNEGTFYESLNLASLKKLPVIFVCENNAYSSHMPVSACLADTDIYRKAEGFAMPGIRVNGNNIFEVLATAGKAIDNARRGGGPALIECLTYRWRGHVGPNYDLDKGMRTKQDLDYWMSRCPIRALDEALTRHGILSAAEKRRIGEDIDREIEEAVSFALDSPCPDGREVANDVFRT